MNINITIPTDLSEITLRQYKHFLKIQKTVDDEKFLSAKIIEIFCGVKGKTSTYPQTSAALSKFQYGSGTGPKGGLTKGIRKWLQKKRFQFRDKKGRFMSYESMTFLISRSIYNKGLKANLFFTKPFEAGLRKFPEDLIMAYSLDIDNSIILGTKK